MYVVHFKTVFGVILSLQGDMRSPSCHSNACQTHLWWVFHDVLFTQKCLIVIWAFNLVQEARRSVVEHDTGLVIPKELWQMILEIYVQVLMAFGFHEDFHGRQYLRHPMATVVGPFLLLLLFKGQLKAIDNQSDLLQAVEGPIIGIILILGCA